MQEIEQDTVETPAVDQEPAPAIHSRFLFVDVAAQRAKQLRRGARPRVTPAETAAVARPDVPHKLERVAMEEVRRGLIHYKLPDGMPGPLEESL